MENSKKTFHKDRLMRDSAQERKTGFSSLAVKRNRRGIEAPLALFGSQRRHRIHASSTVGREETSKERRTRQHQSRSEKRQRIARTYIIQDFGQYAPRP